MRTDNMSEEYYNSIIYTKEDLEIKYQIWRHEHIAPQKMEDYIEWARINNWYIATIEGYEIYKKIKSDRLINYDKIL